MTDETNKQAIRQKLTEDERTDIRIAKAEFRKKNGQSWDNKWAKKKVQRKAALAKA